MGLSKKVFIALVLLLSTNFLAFGAEVSQVKKYGRASLEKYHDIYIMKLYGTKREMAIQHASLIVDMASETALPLYGTKIERGLDHAGSWLQRLVGKAVFNYAHYSFRNHLPTEDLEMYNAFADVLKLDRKVVLNAFLFPDIGEYLMAKVYGKNSLIGNLNFPILTGFGCTTVVALDERTSVGPIHARTLDYHGLGLWDKFPAVTYFYPSEPGKVAYAAIGTLGSPVAAPTAYNDAGLIMDLHQSTVDQVSLSGTPIVSIFDRVISRAKTIEEAVELIRASKFTTPWKINMTSTRQNKSVMVEVSAENIEVHHPENGYLVETNHVRSSSMKAAEFSPSYRYTEDSLLRVANTKKILPKKFDTQLALDIITSTTSFADGKRDNLSFHGTVSRFGNVQTVVFAPGRDKIYLGRPPKIELGSSATGDFIVLPFNFNTARSDESELAVRSQPLPENFVKGLASMRKASVLATDAYRFEESIYELLKAQKLLPDEPSLNLLLGLSYFKLAGRHVTQKYVFEDYLNRSYMYLLTLKERTPAGYLNDLASLFIGRTFDLKGERQLALRHYFQVSSGVYSKLLVTEAKNNIKRPYRVDQVQDLVINYMEPDVFRF